MDKEKRWWRHILRQNILHVIIKHDSNVSHVNFIYIVQNHGSQVDFTAWAEIDMLCAQTRHGKIWACGSFWPLSKKNKEIPSKNQYKLVCPLVVLSLSLSICLSVSPCMEVTWAGPITSAYLISFYIIGEKAVCSQLTRWQSTFALTVCYLAQVVWRASTPHWFLSLTLTTGLIHTQLTS